MWLSRDAPISKEEAFQPCLKDWPSDWSQHRDCTIQVEKCTVFKSTACENFLDCFPMQVDHSKTFCFSALSSRQWKVCEDKVPSAYRWDSTSPRKWRDLPKVIEKVNCDNKESLLRLSLLRWKPLIGYQEVKASLKRGVDGDLIHLPHQKVIN